MACDELEALRLGLLNVLGPDDRTARERADVSFDAATHPAESLAHAETLADVERHLGELEAELEERVELLEESDPDYDAVRGRMLAVHDAARAVSRFRETGESLLDDVDATHRVVHDAFDAAHRD